MTIPTYVKLIMQYDVLPDRQAEYFEFTMREFMPGLSNLGIRTTEVWLALFGDCPQIMVEGLTEDLPTMQNILRSPEWDELRENLLKYVTNYEHKVVRVSDGSFQL